MSNDSRFEHLQASWNDVRDELKQRIQQRDQYSMQLTVALSAIAIAAFSPKGTTRFFILAPLVALYFTALILYSYGIHDMLASYLRTEIEPEFRTLSNMPTETEWEIWYRSSGRRPGVRRLFFRFEMWTVTVLSLVFLWHQEGELKWIRTTLKGGIPWSFQTILAAATVIYSISMVWIAFLPRTLPTKERNRDWPQGKTMARWHRAVFLDRDGTINADTHFPSRPEDLEFIPGAKEGLQLLSGLPLDIIVVANQAGIALGYFTRQQMSQFNAALRSQIESIGARIDAFYFCPHLEPKHLKSEEVPCNCSKPAPGMLLKAAQDFDIHLGRSFMIGDKTSDIAAGQAAGCITILLKTGKAGQEEGALHVNPTHTAAGLHEAALIIKEYINRESGER